MTSDWKAALVLALCAVLAVPYAVAYDIRSVWRAER